MSNNDPIFDGKISRIKACRHGLTMYFKNDQYVGRALDLYGEFSEAEVSEINIGGLPMGTIPGLKNDHVTVRTLDSFELKKLDFLKVDVEGMEKMVLDGAKETITRCRPIMYIENDRREKSRDLIKTIFDLEYRAWWHLPLFSNPNNYFKNNTKAFNEALASINLLCIPREMNAVVNNMDEVSNIDELRDNKRPIGCY